MNFFEDAMGTLCALLIIRDGSQVRRVALPYDNLRLVNCQDGLVSLDFAEYFVYIRWSTTKYGEQILTQIDTFLDKLAATEVRAIGPYRLPDGEIAIDVEKVGSEEEPSVIILAARAAAKPDETPLDLETATGGDDEKNGRIPASEKA